MPSLLANCVPQYANSLLPVLYLRVLSTSHFASPAAHRQTDLVLASALSEDGAEREPSGCSSA